MSSAPQLSLDERERRARMRVEQQKERDARAAARRNGTPLPRSARPAEAARQEMLAPVEAQKGFSPPRPGESLFDNYANLADPLAFSTDEEEVDNLMRMGVGVRREASWDEERHREAVRQLVSIRRPPSGSSPPC